MLELFKKISIKKLVFNFLVTKDAKCRTEALLKWTPIVDFSLEFSDLFKTLVFSKQRRI